MKKLFFAASIILASMTMYSCSNDETETTTAKSVNENLQKKGLQELQSNIANLNKEWQDKRPIVLTRNELTNQITETATNSISITGADLAGAFLGAYLGCGVPGAIIGGAAASAIAYWERETYGYSTKIEIDYYVPANSLIFKNNEIATKADSIGYYHNKILMNIGENKLTNASIDDIEGLVINSAIEIMGNTIESNNKKLRNNICTDFFKKKITRLNTAKTTEEFYDKISEVGKISKEKLEIIKTYMDGLNNIDNTNGEYSKAVERIIDDAEISTETATNLKNSVLVGNASQKLWSIQ